MPPVLRSLITERVELARSSAKITLITASLLGSNAVFAQDAVTDAEFLWKKAGVKISGAVEVSYTQT